MRHVLGPARFGAVPRVYREHEHVNREFSRRSTLSWPEGIALAHGDMTAKETSLISDQFGVLRSCTR
jgi:hypothetical protein